MNKEYYDQAKESILSNYDQSNLKKFAYENETGQKVNQEEYTMLNRVNLQIVYDVAQKYKFFKVVDSLCNIFIVLIMLSDIFLFVQSRIMVRSTIISIGSILILSSIALLAKKILIKNELKSTYSIAPKQVKSYYALIKIAYRYSFLNQEQFIELLKSIAITELEVQFGGK